MTLLATVMQVGAAALLVLLPSLILAKDRLRISIALCFFAILAVSHVGGLLYAAPTAVFLFVFALWISFVGHAQNGAKRTLFKITVILCALFLIQQIIHLPIRFLLEQPVSRIAANIAGIFLAAALLGAPLETLYARRRKAISRSDPFMA